MSKRLVASALLVVALLWSGPLSAAPLNLVHKKVVDLDGDGRHDIVVYDTVGSDAGTFYVLQGGNNYSSAFSVKWGLAGDQPVLADFDNDNRLDVAVFRTIVGASDVGTWYILQGGTNFTSAFSVKWGVAFDEPVPGDYDGDGKTDIAVYRQNCTAGPIPGSGCAGGPAPIDQGTWYILQGGTGFATAFSVKWGRNNAIPRPADYDGDGRLDLAVIPDLALGGNPAPGDLGVWYILQGGTSFSTAFAVKWGNGSFSDIPYPGDFDGDGRIDLAVFRSFPNGGTAPPSDVGSWYVLQGGTGFTKAFKVSWGKTSAQCATTLSSFLDPISGGSGDCALGAPADYDGDGRLDIAFYPNTGFTDSGRWYILQGGTGFTTAFSVRWGTGNFGQRGLGPLAPQGRYYLGLY